MRCDQRWKSHNRRRGVYLQRRDMNWELDPGTGIAVMVQAQTDPSRSEHEQGDASRLWMRKSLARVALQGDVRRPQVKPDEVVGIEIH